MHAGAESALQARSGSRSIVSRSSGTIQQPGLANDGAERPRDATHRGARTASPGHLGRLCPTLGAPEWRRLKQPGRLGDRVGRLWRCGGRERSCDIVRGRCETVCTRVTRKVTESASPRAATRHRPPGPHSISKLRSSEHMQSMGREEVTARARSFDASAASSERPLPFPRAGHTQAMWRRRGRRALASTLRHTPTQCSDTRSTRVRHAFDTILTLICD